MNATELKNRLIEELTPYAKVPVFPADENRPKPKGAYVTFKLTTPKAQGVGQPEITYTPSDDGLTEKYKEEYLTTISFTTYDKDEDISRDLALHIQDFFNFYGCEFLESIGVAVAEVTNVINRDVFLIEEYERRNGFDAILRVMQEKFRNVEYFDKVDGVAE